MMKQPMQPIERDDDGVIRSRHNLLVRHLVNSFDGGVDGLRLACPEASTEDWEQLNPLLGWSVSGYGDLPYVSAETVQVADAIAATIT